MKKVLSKARQFCGVGVLVLLISFIPLPVAAATAAEAPKYADVSVYPGGMPFGVRFGTNEVTVLRLTHFTVEGKDVSPAADAGILPEDVILSVNGEKISTLADVTRMAESLDASPITLTVRRRGRSHTVSITPARSDDGDYRLGFLLKDTSAGIGTVTFIKEDALRFGGLGHGICDTSDGHVLPLTSGRISDVIINGIHAGKAGAPGELRGSFTGDVCGKLLANTEVGLFGMYMTPRTSLGEPTAVAEAAEVTLGAATIRCTLEDNRKHDYSIEITEINRDSNAKTKNYVLKVTDARLLSKTGGIVQGMSGSPIFQHGKLIGAVTHVLINDPTTGYGIYIGNMLDELDKLI